MVGFAILGDAHTNFVCTCLTRQFLVESYDVMNYIFVAYIYKLHGILLRSIKTREDASMVTAFKSVYTELKEKGHKLTFHVLGNECSLAIKTYIASEKGPIQIVAQDDQKINTCEPSVNSTKYHVMSTIATAGKTCPLQLWSRFFL